MSDATMHVKEATEEVVGDAPAAPHGRVRTCVGCGERVDLLAGEVDFVRLILGPDGTIAVDPKGGGFGRGAHVHARFSCVDRAARSGLLRATKGRARLVLGAEAGEAGDPQNLGLDGEVPHVEGPNTDAASAPLRTDSLARAIQGSMDRRIEGLLGAAVRSRQVAWGADAVTGACRRGEAELVVVACDAAAAADLAEVRRAVAEGRAVAWGTKQRLGALVRAGARPRRGAIALTPVRGTLAPSPGDDGVGVVAIASRTIAMAVRQAVHAANAVGSSEASERAAASLRQGGPTRPPRAPKRTARNGTGEGRRQDDPARARPGSGHERGHPRTAGPAGRGQGRRRAKVERSG